MRAITILAFLLSAATTRGQDDVAGVPNRKLELDDGLQCFVIGEQKRTPKDGYGVIVVLPGGTGSADFNPFVRRIWKHAIPKGYLVVQLVARRWTPDQRVVWPTAKTRVAGMKKTTEEHLELALKAVAKDETRKIRFDRQRIFTLSWSSGGPAAYQISVSSDYVRGSFVAMSVFKPKAMASLKRARGHAYYLYHSRTDDRCPFSDAEKAEKALGKAGAEVELTEYEGGHRWGAGVYQDIRTGIEWLEQHAGR